MIVYEITKIWIHGPFVDGDPGWTRKEWIIDTTHLCKNYQAIDNIRSMYREAWKNIELAPVMIVFRIQEKVAA